MLVSTRLALMLHERCNLPQEFRVLLAQSISRDPTVAISYVVEIDFFHEPDPLELFNEVFPIA